MSRYCLDTSAYSQFKRGDTQAIEAIDAATWVGVPTIVIGELWIGFLAGRKQKQNQDELRQFLAHRLVEQIAVDAEIARIYAEIVLTLRSAGTPLPTNDIWIAAAAARFGATVLTYDSHFSSIGRVASLVLSAH